MIAYDQVPMRFHHEPIEPFQIKAVHIIIRVSKRNIFGFHNFQARITSISSPTVVLMYHLNPCIYLCILITNLSAYTETKIPIFAMTVIPIHSFLSHSHFDSKQYVL